jgi:tRNA threonylcarbamoyladenosine biosynthesis protein TsaB
MLLAIDTATRVASVALYNGDGVQAETTWRSRENHTVELMAQIAHMMELARVAKNDLKAIGVALGPGSFTGLRVGLSVAKGLALGSKIPLLGVPTLDALAHAHSAQPLPIWALVAAGRGRFSVAHYTTRRGATRRVSDYALVDANGLVELVSRESKGGVRTYFCGEIDAALAQLLAERLGPRAVIASSAMTVRRAGFLAELAWARFLRGASDDTASLGPMYMPYPSVENTAKR